ncbi:MAG: hypothetical protein DRG78_08320, partial [Epsilonproteobacteria bacterium]
VNSVLADDGFEDEEGFGDDEVIEVVKVKEEEKKDFTYYGSLTASSEYSHKDKSEFSSNKLSANIKIEYIVDEFHKIKSTIKTYKAYDTKVDDDRDFDINELSVEGTFHNGIDGKVGRQIVVWGKSDNIRITDTLNPMDMTAPGMVDINDLRLGRNMTKLDYFSGKWTFTGLLLHEQRFSELPKLKSEYYKGIAVDAPSDSLDNTGVAFSLSGNLEGQDIAFYASNQYIDNKIYKSNMIGFAYNKVIDSFLLKTEIAHFDNYDSTIVDAKTDGLIGIEYNGISDGSISLEVANKNEDIQYALRFTQSYINQTLDFTALYSGYGKELEDGGFVRVWGDYAYNDEVAFSLGMIDYQGGDNAYFENIKDNDRIFGSVKYSF